MGLIDRLFGGDGSARLRRQLRDLEKRLAAVEAELAVTEERIVRAAKSTNGADFVALTFASANEQLGGASSSGTPGFGRLAELKAQRTALQKEIDEVRKAMEEAEPAQ